MLIDQVVVVPSIFISHSSSRVSRHTLQFSLLVPDRSELGKVGSQALALEIKRVVTTQTSAAAEVCCKDTWT